MCRHLAWLGEPRSLAALTLEPPFGLLHQSYAPRRQKRGVVNADGWGVGFFAEDRTEPVRWRSVRPLWSEQAFASIAPLLSSRAVLAAVRSASPGMPIEESATAPFTDGTWVLSHNGRVRRDVVPREREAESLCDAALLAAHVFQHGPDHLGTTISELAAADPQAVLTVLMIDRRRILGLTWGEALCYRATGDGVLVASEPSDDGPGWIDVPDRHLIEVTAAGVTVTDLQ